MDCIRQWVLDCLFSRSIRYLTLCMICWLGNAAYCQAAHVPEHINESLPDGVHASAEFIKPEEGKPVVLVLHPFLQTYSFSVIENLTESLVSEGYGVLRPTLSLGIDYRKQSLACEAVHGYSLDEKVQELQFWSDWLRKRKINDVIGFGHSSGATMVAMYQAQSRFFKSLILLSPVHYGYPGGTGIDPAQRDKALQDEAAGVPDGLQQFKLSFCENFAAPRKRYLEYIAWDEAKVVELIRSLQVRTDVVFGTKDPSLNPSWKKALEESDVEMTYVTDGNHFFSGPAEFDMHDAFLELLSGQ